MATEQWYHARAAELHKEGAKRFGWDWVKANQLVSTGARQADSIGEFTGRDRWMLSRVAFALCEHWEKERNGAS